MEKYLFLFVLVFFSHHSALAQKRLVVLGDSLTEGYGVAKDSAYPALLELKIQTSGKNWKVINAGITGSTTASAPGRLKWILKAKPDLILLVLGGNDGLRGLKVSASEKNLATAIELIKKENVKVVLVGIYTPPNYGQEYGSQFRKMYSDLAKKYAIPLIPFILDQVAGNPKLNQADGIHPNEAGHKIMAENVFNSLKDLL